MSSIVAVVNNHLLSGAQMTSYQQPSTRYMHLKKTRVRACHINLDSYFVVTSLQAAELNTLCM